MLRLQDKNYSKSLTFHETYLSLTNDIRYGGGMFAFVTIGGIRLLLEDSKFEEMMSSIEIYTLIIGIDSITNDKALDKLNELIQKYDGKLVVKAFYNNYKGRIFHPKLSWFKGEEKFSLIIGSSNLTEGGLRRNIEGYFHAEYANSDFSMVEDEWTSWIAENEERLLDISDERVIQKCKCNKRKRALQRKIIKKLNEEFEEEVHEESIDIDTSINDVVLDNLDDETDDEIELIIDEWGFDEESEILIAEIPRSKNRWNQANFSKKVFMEFFGATPGDNSQRILLKHITETQVGETEVRPSITVTSNNYRFELDGAKHLDYPTEGTPIGVFVKVSVRQFLYTLIMPGEDLYAPIKGMIVRLNPNPGRLMRREVLKVSKVKREINTLPFWRIM